jgi:hypothetical protein
MQNPAGNAIEIQPDDRHDAYGSVVSDLVGLIEHVQASLKLIESAIAREASLGDGDGSPNVIVLDDVTPCYAKASAALKACNADLGNSLHFLLDSRISTHGADGFVATQPALSAIGA